MAMRFSHDITTTIGEYVNKQGETKKRYIKIGAMFTDDESGRMSIKLDALPMPSIYEGKMSCWLSCFAKDGDGGQQQQQPQQQQPQQQRFTQNDVPQGNAFAPQQQQPNAFAPQQQQQQQPQQGFAPAPVQNYQVPADEIPF